MSIIINGELHTITHSLTGMHLGHAVDQMKRSKVISQTATTGFEKMLVEHLALSSILHGFCALDSTVNYFGYEMFFHPESDRYVRPEKRDVLLKKFVKSWNKAVTLEKLDFILSYSSNSSLQTQIANRLRELNTLRNWIAHGFTYTTTLLLEPKAEGDSSWYNVVEMEYSVDWKSKFPITKFNPIGEINFKDAQVALRIVFDVLRVISDCLSQPFEIVTCEYNPEYSILWQGTFDNPKLLEL